MCRGKHDKLQLVTKLMNLFLVAVTYPLAVFSAPAPVTSSSALTNPKYGNFFLSKGFTLSDGKTGWSLSENTKFISSNQRGRLDIKMDILTTEFNSSSFGQRWLKDYPHFGFEVLGSTAFKQNNQVGYVIDMISPKKSVQVRQVVFVKDQKAVILTCTDEIKSFNETLKGCNKIIKTFSWTSDLNRKAF